MKNWKIWLAVLVGVFLVAMLKDRNTVKSIEKTSSSLIRMCMKAMEASPAIPADKHQTICECTNKTLYSKIGADGFERIAGVSTAKPTDQQATQDSMQECAQPYIGSK
jgi:hypothetical protein